MQQKQLKLGKWLEDADFGALQRRRACLCNHILQPRCDLDLWPPESNQIIRQWICPVSFTMKLFKPFMRYRGNNICVNRRTDGRTDKRTPTMSGGECIKKQQTPEQTFEKWNESTEFQLKLVAMVTGRRELMDKSVVCRHKRSDKILDSHQTCAWPLAANHNTELCRQ